MKRNEYREESSKVHREGGDTWSVFRSYYGQFVNQRTIGHVVRIIGADKIMKSTDRAFNDIPMQFWDRATATGTLPVEGKIAEFGDYWTPAGLTCVAKEAAMQYKETNA